MGGKASKAAIAIIELKDMENTLELAIDLGGAAYVDNTLQQHIIPVLRQAELTFTISNDPSKLDRALAQYYRDGDLTKRVKVQYMLTAIKAAIANDAPPHDLRNKDSTIFITYKWVCAGIKQRTNAHLAKLDGDGSASPAASQGGQKKRTTRKVTKKP
jgi:hypothetical protein